MPTAPRPASYSTKWVRILPFLGWLPLVNRQTLGADLSAGLTGAVVVLPQGVAFATIAGMPPEYGLYAGMIPAVIAALFGSSWHLVSGPTTAASIVLYASLSAFAPPGTPEYVSLALTLAFMVGVLQLTMGLFRLGTVVNFISHSVVIGFTAGAGILIIANQIKNFFGLPIPQGANFHDIIAYFIDHYADASPAVTTVSVVTLLSGIVTRKLWPKIPYMIVAIFIGSATAFALTAGLGETIPSVGSLPASLPPLSSPNFSMQAMRDLAPTALAVTLFALTEAISISRALAVRSGQHINSNQEFVGQGLSNIAGSFFSAYVATGSFNRSGVNYDAGAKTPLAAIVAGALLIPIVLLVAPYAVYLPNAAMGGILFLVAWGLIDFKHIVQIMRASKAETAVLTVTFVATLFLSLELAIFSGVMLSLALYLNRTSHPTILARVPNPADPNRKLTTNPRLPECPQVKILEIDGELFFGAVNYFQETLRTYERTAPDQKHLVIDMSGVNFIDVAGAETLVQEARRYRGKGGGLYFLHAKEAVLSRLRRGRYIKSIGEDTLFISKTKAMAAVYARLDRETCAACDKRIFRECAAEFGPAPAATVSAAPVSAIAAKKTYHRILAVVALDGSDSELVRNAAQLAKSIDAELALGHIADWEAGLGYDGALTPVEVEKKLVEVVRGKLKTLAVQAGTPGAEILIAFPGWDRGVADLARTWHPDLIVAPSSQDHDLIDGGRLRITGWECDTAIVRVPLLARFGWIKELWPTDPRDAKPN